MGTTLAERLIYAREASGFPRVKPAAERAGITPSALYQLESGKTKALSGDTAQKLAAIYQGFRIEWLISGTGSKMSGVGESYGMSHPPRWDPETLAASIKLVRLTYQNLGFQYDPEEDAVPIIYAYDYLLDREQRVVTPENLVDFSKKLAEKLRGSNDDQDSRSGSAGGIDSGEGQGRKAG